MEKEISFKCLLIGDGAVGKSTFVRRHRTGDFMSQYLPTVGVEVHPLRFETTYGTIIFKVWDTAGQEKFGGLRDAYYTNGDCAIIMYDLTDRMTIHRVWTWYRDLRAICPSIPVVIIGNKKDALNPIYPSERFLAKIKEKGMEFFSISAKSQENCELPFLYLARKLNNDDLEFVAEEVTVPPPEIDFYESGDLPSAQFLETRGLPDHSQY